MCVGAEGREGWKSLPESDEIDEVYSHMGIPVAQVEKNLPANAGDADVSAVPRLGRYPWVGNGNLFQYSCLENSMDRGT